MNEAVLYVKYVDKHKLIVSMYVDDLLIIGNNEQLVEEFEANIKDKFEMNELGFLTYFLGIKVTRSVQGYLLCQKRFTLKLLNKFAMENCKLVSIPMVLGQKLIKEDGAPKTDGKAYRSLVGSLLYLTTTYPNIVFDVNYLPRFMQGPSQIHFMAAKRVLKYLKRTIEFGMHFVKSSSVKLIGFSNND